MFLNLIDRMMRQILVQLGDYVSPDLGMKKSPQIAQDSWWGGDDKRLELVFKDEALEHAGDILGEPVLLEVVPVSRFDGAALMADTRKDAPRLVRALLARWWIYVGEHALDSEIGKLLVAVVAQEKRLAAVSHKHQRVLRHPYLVHCDAPVCHRDRHRAA